jgi:hypothetical protein
MASISGLLLFSSSVFFSRFRRRLLASPQRNFVDFWLKKDSENEYLKEVLGDKALSWVKHENNDTLSFLGNPTESPLYGKVKNILDSKEKVICHDSFSLFSFCSIILLDPFCFEDWGLVLQFLDG